MGGRYLLELADVCRRAGLPTIEVEGWHYRARSSGGYDSGRPTHVMVHHTASGPSSDGWPDVNYMCSTSNGNYPTANLYLNRTGTVWVMAGGATNTNGSGSDWWGGGVPDDSMNTHAIGVEAGNDGLGEPWADAQESAYLVLVGALVGAYGIPTSHCRAHFEWAPDRKVDPAGPSRWSPHASGGGGGNEWLMDRFRNDVGFGPGPAPEQGGDDVLVLFRVTDAAKSGVHYRTNGVHYTVISDGDDEAALQLFLTKLGVPMTSVQTCTKAQVGFAGIYLDIGTGQPRANPYL